MMVRGTPLKCPCGQPAMPWCTSRAAVCKECRLLEQKRTLSFRKPKLPPPEKFLGLREVVASERRRGLPLQRWGGQQLKGKRAVPPKGPVNVRDRSRNKNK
jgi:hypothetical protein